MQTCPGFSWNPSWNLLEICSVKFVDTCYRWQWWHPTGGLTALVGWLGLRVGGRLVCSHHMNLVCFMLCLCLWTLVKALPWWQYYKRWSLVIIIFTLLWYYSHCVHSWPTRRRLCRGLTIMNFGLETSPAVWVSWTPERISTNSYR